jgi:hypothetical protein
MMDEFEYHTAGAKAGVLFIRSLSDDVLRQAMDDGTPGFALVLNQMGPDTNHFWITSEAIEEAYRRGLIDETEMDYRNR